MRLTSIYERPDRAQILFQLLEEREPDQNISHKAMPTWKEHLSFVESKPYKAWYFIEDEGIVGACYLSKQDEIGIFVFKAHQGKNYGPLAVKAIMHEHGKRRYLANIAPGNERSRRIFRDLGFKHIQCTYELV